ncbi:uncharacterized protein RAG0_09328 [Rhynchosporium agropyri]|uniref:Fungal N-terminal domain-containing protein n=1 Tax=Rhynchosporium agropyri TaxID=914238 RepID=A0A1E1KV19_9HELO|nr:uncharacterized protein RAG0_09328 [Rhynchosporium agropyri]
MVERGILSLVEQVVAEISVSAPKPPLYSFLFIFITYGVPVDFLKYEVLTLVFGFTYLSRRAATQRSANTLVSTLAPIDPFSAAAAAVGLIDVLWKVSSYLNNVRHTAEAIQDKPRSLHKQIHALISVDKALTTLKRRRETDYDIPHLAKAKECWVIVESNREGCKKIVLGLEEKLAFIMAGKGKGLMNPIASALEKQASHDVRTEISGLLIKDTNSEYLDADKENRIYTENALMENGKAIEGLKIKGKTYYSELLTQLKYLIHRAGSEPNKELQQAIDAAARISAKPLNKHFFIPTTIKSFYISRIIELEELADCLKDNKISMHSYPIQKRFVVEGLGSSRKT